MHMDQIRSQKKADHRNHMNIITWAVRVTVATVGSGLGLWLLLLRSAGESEARVCETAGSEATRNPPHTVNQEKK